MDSIEALVSKLNTTYANLQCKLNQLRIDTLVVEAELRQVREVRDNLADITKAKGRES